ncbi:MAG: DUF3108 domain-containing protein [Bacteroidetes bacterium]|nr:DUF3108 domain-containing protein [Bacteroidota bacterium]
MIFKLFQKAATILFILSPFLMKAQCYQGNTVFGDGEDISYTIHYNWGPIWVDAGVVTFKAKLEKKGEKQVWHLTSTGKTFPSYDALFKVRDYYDTWVDPETFHTINFKRYIYEGGYTLVNTLNFDHEKKKIYSSTKSNNNPVRFDTISIQACSFDMLAAVYFTRTIDMGHIPMYQKRQVSVVIDDQVYNIYIRPLAKEVVENNDGKKYNCIKMSAKMVEGTIFKGDEDVLVWITDDDNRIPVYIEAKILVGTVKAYLHEAKGLRNPMKALIKK